MLPAAIAHISGELLSLACFSTMPGGMVTGVLEGHRGSQVTTPFSCSATPGCHLSLSPPPSLFLVPIDMVRFLDASRSLPLPPDLHSFWIELHPFSRFFQHVLYFNVFCRHVPGPRIQSGGLCPHHPGYLPFAGNVGSFSLSFLSYRSTPCQLWRRHWSLLRAASL